MADLDAKWAAAVKQLARDMGVHPALADQMILFTKKLQEPLEVKIRALEVEQAVSQAIIAERVQQVADLRAHIEDLRRANVALTDVLNKLAGPDEIRI